MSRHNQRRYPEFQLGCAVADFLRLRRVQFFHIANERRTTALQGRNLQRLGVRPGVADLCLMFPDHVVFIELKAGKNGLSPTQKEFASWCDENHIPYYVARSIDDVASVVARHGQRRAA